MLSAAGGGAGTSPGFRYGRGTVSISLPDR